MLKISFFGLCILFFGVCIDKLASWLDFFVLLQNSDAEQESRLGGLWLCEIMRNAFNDDVSKGR